ncbi:tetratricopeptide repeat protein [Halobacteriovorax sp.]|uniref:tetratricopeptide repeat protein n=1 Tax=Halobacteriovorax sp. TaxID=2020862 RepID=UPI0035694FAA
MKKLIVTFFLMLSFSSFAAELVINSNPSECDIFVISSSGKKSAIGKTPYKGNLDSLKSTFGLSGTVQILVHKPGFETFNILVPVISSSDVILNANLEVERSIKITQDVDLLVTDLFDVLRMMRVKDFPSAYAKLERLEAKFPHYSIIYEMKGSISYMQKEFKKALNYYRKAFGVNPKNREAYRMKVYLEKMFKVSTTSAGGKR